MFENKKFAFTLTEVLITVGIIGIVAALTIVPLVYRVQDRIAIEQLKKNYALITNAFKLAQEEYGFANTWGASEDVQETQTMWFNRVAKYLKVIDNCGAGVRACYKKHGINYVRGLDNKVSYFTLKTHEAQLINGAFITFESCGNMNYKSWGNIYIDINGSAKPNTRGKDVFQFSIAVDKDWDKNLTPKIVPSGFSNPNYCLTGRYGLMGAECTAWVMKYNNMDYLHCKDKLLQSGKTSCS